ALSEYLAEREPAEKCGDESVAVHCHCGRVSAHRQAQHRRAGKAFSGPAVPTRGVHEQAARTTCGHADENAHSQLGGGYSWTVADNLASRCRSRQCDRYKGRSDPVIEAAFDIDQPANPCRYYRVGHHAGAECGVGSPRRGDEILCSHCLSLLASSDRRAYGQPATAAGAWTASSWPVRDLSVMRSVPRHWVATMNSVVRSGPPSAQEKQPRSSRIVSITAPPSRTRTHCWLGTSAYQMAPSA